MLTPSEREQAVTLAAQAVRDREILDRLDKIIELLTAIRDDNKPPLSNPAPPPIGN